MVTVKIPNDMSPWVCVINGKVYIYPPDTEQSVPEEVAALIASQAATFPKPKDVDQPWEPDISKELEPYAKIEDVMPKAASITGYDAAKAQILQHDATGALKWVDAEVDAE